MGVQPDVNLHRLTSSAPGVVKPTASTEVCTRAKKATTHQGSMTARVSPDLGASVINSHGICGPNVTRLKLERGHRDVWGGRNSATAQ